MSTKRLMIASFATLALSLSGYTTLAEPSASSGADIIRPSVVNPDSSLTMVKGHSSGGHSSVGFSRGFSGGISSHSRVPGGRSMMMNRRALNRGMAWDHDRRGHGRHFRHRHFVNGVWVWDDYDYGGSCYTNCLEAGYSPRYCSTYSYNFC